MVFQWNNTTIPLPRITDIVGPSHGFPPDILRIFTYPWIWFLGGWFIAAVLGVLGAALYIKSNNAMYPVVFFILSMVLVGPVFGADPGNGLPTAQIFGDLVGVICAFVVGFLVYQLYRESK